MEHSVGLVLVGTLLNNTAPQFVDFSLEGVEDVNTIR